MGEASNDQILAAVLDLKQDVGRIEARVENTTEHTLGVSRKTDALRDDMEKHKAEVQQSLLLVRESIHMAPCGALRAHEDTYSAHGARAIAWVGGVITAGLGSIALAVKLYHDIIRRP